MIKTKNCVDCPSVHTIKIDPDNKKKILRIQGEYLMDGKRRSIEQIINQLVKNCDR